MTTTETLTTEQIKALRDMDVWGKLWEIATGEAGGPAQIIPDPDGASWVTLVWPDGSRNGFCWHDNHWLLDSACAAPADVAARDSL